MPETLIHKDYAVAELEKLEKAIAELIKEHKNDTQCSFRLSVKRCADTDCYCTGFNHKPGCHNHWTNRNDREIPY